MLSKFSNFWLVFIGALLVRLIYLWMNIPDYWGDAYHSVFISRATVDNGWIYSDFSGREVVWLPFYRYLATFFMFIFDEYNLTVAHYLNSIIGALTCAITTALVGLVSGRKIAIFSGTMLAILPWHIAYSNINTPEILSGFFIVLVIFLWKSNRAFWILPVAILGVLTRNEVTLLLAVFGAFLLIKKDFKPALALLLGALIGLFIWSYWCYSQTGHWFWWISERSLGSSWNHLYQTYQGRALGKWYFPLLSVLQSFPYLLVIVFIFLFLKKYIFKENKTSINSLLVPVSIILFFDWIFIFLMQFRFYSYPEPKYFIITLPLACIFMGLMVGTIRKDKLHRILRNTLAFGVIIMLLQTPVFYYLHFQDDPSKKVGLFIKDHLGSEGNIWMDHTISWYYSEIDYKRIYGSYKLTSRFERYEEGFEDRLRNKLDELDIRYVMSEPSSFTNVYDFWPEMKDDRSFEWKGITFHPIFQYERPSFSNSLNDRIKDVVIPKNIDAKVWQMERGNE